MICSNCGISFSPRDYRQRNCSRMCYMESRDRGKGLVGRKGEGTVVAVKDRIAFRVVIDNARYEELRYRAVAGLATGGLLSSEVEVHHNDGICTNDMPSNLAICETHEAHLLLEAYTRIRIAGFHSVPEMPQIPNVVWIACYLRDDPDTYEIAREWWLDRMYEKSGYNRAA